MYDKEFTRLVKIAVENLKEETIYQMVQQSVEYQKEKDLSGLAEERYLELDLTKEQREVCDTLLDCRDSQNLEYADFSYIAGLYDAFRILAVIFPNRWDMEQVKKVLCVKLKTE